MSRALIQFARGKKSTFRTGSRTDRGTEARGRNDPTTDPAGMRIPLVHQPAWQRVIGQLIAGVGKGGAKE